MELMRLMLYAVTVATLSASMSKYRFPPSLAALGAHARRARARVEGYVRSGPAFFETTWSLEILSEDNKVAVATIQTADGPVYIGLNQSEAAALAQKLQLFLTKWPKDRATS